MRECWLSPYGEVIYTSGMWEHANTAAKILFERYNDGSWKNPGDVWYECATSWASYSPTDMLQEKGWVRYSTVSNKWIVGEEYDIHPTQDQKDKIFDLTGEIVE